MEIHKGDLDWANKANSNAKAKHSSNRGPNGGHIAFLSFENELDSPSTTKNQNNSSSDSRQPLSPSLNRLNQNNSNINLRKAAIKNNAFQAMPPPPTRRPSRQAPPVPPVNSNNSSSSTSSSSTATSANTETLSPMDGMSSKRSADDERSGQKPTKRRRVGTVTKNNLGETVEKQSLHQEDLMQEEEEDEESIPMEVEAPTPVSVRSSQDEKVEEQKQRQFNIQKQAEEFKQLGNEKYTSCLYVEASAFYTKASNLVHHTSPIYLCNRAACWLMLKEFEKALDDALAAIAIDNTFVRALERAGKASLSLGHGKECCKYMTTAIESLRKDSQLNPNNESKNLKKIEELKIELSKADKYEHSLSRAERSIKRHDGASAISILSDAFNVVPTASDAKLLLVVASIVDGSWSGVVDASSTKPDPLTMVSSIIGECRDNSITSRASVSAHIFTLKTYRNNINNLTFFSKIIFFFF
jgi:tetratricopeptide (TPR) repeat protein